VVRVEGRPRVDVLERPGADRVDQAPRGDGHALGRLEADRLGNISSFVEGNDGELYVTYGVSTRIGRLAPQ